MTSASKPKWLELHHFLPGFDFTSRFTCNCLVGLLLKATEATGEAPLETMPKKGLRLMLLLAYIGGALMGPADVR